MHLSGLSLLGITDIVKEAVKGRSWARLAVELEKYPWLKGYELIYNAIHFHAALRSCAQHRGRGIQRICADFGLKVEDDAFDWTADDVGMADVLVALWICKKKTVCREKKSAYFFFI